MGDKVQPNTQGVWAAKDGIGKIRTFPTVNLRGGLKVYHRDWRTIEETEASFPGIEWLGEVTEALFKKGGK